MEETGKTKGQEEAEAFSPITPDKKDYEKKKKRMAVTRAFIVGAAAAGAAVIGTVMRKRRH